MKRYLAALLSLLLLLSLVACRTGEGTDETSGSESTAETSDAVTTDEVIEESPVEDFEYSVHGNQDVYITKYLGNDAHVVIPERIEGVPVAVIAGSAFENNNTLVSIVIPDTVTSIFEDAFANCSLLETVVMSKNVIQIRGSAFFECTNLSAITLPDTLTRIGNSAFESCVSLKHIRIPAIPFEGWGEGVFKNSGLETIDFEEGVTHIVPYTFWGTKVKSLIFPQSMRWIGYCAYCYCEELESIVLNDGIETIAANAFGYSKITEIVIPASVTNMEGIFSGCEDLKKIFFEGDTPEELFPLSPKPLSCTIYYHEGAEGFTSPEWNGYPTEIW